MIGYLKGNCIQKSKRSLILEVNGVGYKVFVPAEILDTAGKGTPLELFIHTVVREDDFSLYGFATGEALAFFELLISVNRVGPKLALDMMNTSLPKLKQAIITKNVGFIASVPGVGRKTAERVALELHEKIGPFSADGVVIPEQMHEDVVQALMKLGYDRKVISRGLKDIPTNVTSDEEIIKYFLQHA